MHIPQLLETRLHQALAQLTDHPADFAGMIRSTNDPKFGDYQCNCAMPLAKQLGKNPRLIAQEIVEHLAVDSFCETPEIAGPGFINLKVRDSFIASSIIEMLDDDRCGVPVEQNPATIIVDFSSPNVAKPMHVGHIRSTVIGDALARTLRFLGHHVVTDNHLGDWGTQFGIIIYGYKHFGDAAKVTENPVPELASLYRLVNQIAEYQKAKSRVGDLRAEIETLAADADAANALAEQSTRQADPQQSKKQQKAAATAQRRQLAAQDQLKQLIKKIAAVQADPELVRQSDEHPRIAARCLQETAKLHEGDAENLALWKKFLPFCQDEINRIYDRLDVRFDHTLGESFYHGMLPGLVDGLIAAGLAVQSDGAICVFLDDYDAPMIIRKRDGAFLYATTDLATLQYRKQAFHPDEILYVVDTRQGEHFKKLFAVAKMMGMQDIRVVHVNFGTVLGEDGKPLKTRSGTLIGLEGLLDDAVARAAAVVCDPERLRRLDPPMNSREQADVAETVGIGAIKFADLSHHRASDYRFNLEKMVALEGNTSTYIQYSYARTQSILRKADTTESSVIDWVKQNGLSIDHPMERALALRMMQLEEALLAARSDYGLNHVTEYLFETARAYAVFNENCPVIQAEQQSTRMSRLALVMQCGHTLRLGLSLLGIGIVPRM